MGIFTEAKQTFSNRKITKTFIKQHKFYMDRWGGPEDRKKPTSIFYEYIVTGRCEPFPFETVTIATIKYFPEDFDGYTTIGRTWGHGNVAGKLVITYENGSTFEYTEQRGFTDTLIFNCKTHSDFHDAITVFNHDLIGKGYEPIKFR